ncbi:MAG: hypothetical protein Q8Q60_01205 [Candidatus Chromulinivorax sp.]|nr:hypothetical protein [Candidatus Chromulinivorax sp.]
MIKKNIFLCTLLLSTPIFSIFDLSPWIVVENKTKLNFLCKVEAIFYRSEGKQIILDIENIQDRENVHFVFENDEDDDENESLKVTINFISYAQQTFVFNSIFYIDGILENPEIINIDFTHQSLQIINFCTPTTINQRYFSIEQQEELGIITNTYEISIYIKCLNNFKQMIRNILAAASNAANLLPY